MGDPQVIKKPQNKKKTEEKAKQSPAEVRAHASAALARLWTPRLAAFVALLAMAALLLVLAWQQQLKLPTLPIAVRVPDFLLAQPMPWAFASLTTVGSLALGVWVVRTQNFAVQKVRAKAA